MPPRNRRLPSAIALRSEGVWSLCWCSLLGQQQILLPSPRGCGAAQQQQQWRRLSASGASSICPGCSRTSTPRPSRLVSRRLVVLAVVVPVVEASSASPATNPCHSGLQEHAAPRPRLRGKPLSRRRATSARRPLRWGHSKSWLWGERGRLRASGAMARMRLPPTADAAMPVARLPLSLLRMCGSAWLRS